MRTTFGLVCLCLVSACTFESRSVGDDDDDVRDGTPVASDDAITTTANLPGSANLLANDRDPDNDALSVTSFTQGAHGAVAIANGVATYTPAPGYVGADRFTYTVGDGHGQSATASVIVMVVPGTPGCTISVSGPATGTFGQMLHLTATAACNTGPAQVQWYHRVNSAYVVVQPYSTTLTLDIAADLAGNNTFYALVRTQGTTPSQGMSNLLTIKIADNAPQCTAVKMVSPVSGQNLVVNTPQTLTALATCPAGAVPEYQFWVKPSGTSTYQILPGYTTGSGSWVPPTTGSWAIRAVARSAGAHVNYQVGSMSVTVNVIN
jgi:hypothetical protein